MVRGKLRFIEHHRSHLGSAFFPSPFEEAAILSIDGSGDFSTTMLARGKGTQIEVLESLDFPNSVGLFYTAFTQYLGFPHYGDEYKVMGLAPYGNPQYVDKVAEILPLKKGGLFQWPSSHFNLKNGVVSYPDNLPVVAPLFGQKFIDLFGPARQKGDELTQYHMDLAASVQRYTEEVIFHVLRGCTPSPDLKRCALPVAWRKTASPTARLRATHRSRRSTSPRPDTMPGISMGSAQYHWHHDLGRDRVAPIYSAYTGSQFEDDAIAKFLDEEGVEYTRFEKDEDLYDAVSDALVDGNVIGWFSGRAEFGPRALGARSIIADPRREDAKELLNSKIKRRESFRPFAPSILSEHVSDWFELDEPVPFMEKVFPIKPARHAEIPAVTHVDGSGRLQSVYQDVAPRYHALISAFHAKTGVPILLNTSFNENEPIVNAPEHALACYQRTSMDMLVLGNCVVKRNKHTK